MTNRSRKGFTLTELVVVLALLVVVSGMVVTFALMVGSSSEVSSARLDAMQDIRVAEAIIEGFIESDGVTASEDNKTLYKDNTKNANNSLTFIEIENEGKLTIKSGGNENSILLENVKSITFDVASANGENLYYCFITYEVAGKSYTYNFCVNPVVGEQVETSTQSSDGENGITYLKGGA